MPLKHANPVGGVDIASDADGGFEHQRVTANLWNGSAPVRWPGDLANGGLVKIGAVVSAVNSTTTPLGPAAVFTGVWEEVKDYNTILVVYETNVISATNGLAIQWSQDGVNTLISDLFSVTSLFGLFRALPLVVRARYVRVVYTQGPGTQAFFRLQTIYQQGTSRVRVEGVGREAGSSLDNLPVLVGYYNSAGTEVFVPRMQSSGDGVGGAVVGVQVFGYQHRFNGTNFDRERNNSQATLLASASRTATIATADQTNYNWVNFRFTFTIASGTPGFQIRLIVEEKDPANPSIYTNIFTGATQTVAGTTVTRVSPSAPNVGGISANDVIPRIWRAQIEHLSGGGFAAVYSLAVATNVGG